MLSFAKALLPRAPGRYIAFRHSLTCCRALFINTYATFGTPPIANAAGLFKVPPEDLQHILTAAVVGLPNAGKSTLVNQLAGSKISGVSGRKHTTTSPQLGCFTIGSSQVLLYDTPGLVEQYGQGNPLERLRSAWATAAMVDQLLLIVDAEQQYKSRNPSLHRVLQQLVGGPPGTLLSDPWPCPPAVLFLNKQDKLQPIVRTVVLARLAQQLSSIMSFERVVCGSAKLNEGVQELKQFLAAKAQKGKWMMEAGQAHAATPGELAVELVREKLFQRLSHELPYVVSPVLESVSQRRDGGLRIQIVVPVKNRQLKKLVVGKGGQIIQQYVANNTQQELGSILKKPVQLVLSVKCPND